MKVKDAILTQAALANKIAKGDATDAERAEFAQVNAALATPTEVPAMDTQLDTMTKAEFEAHVAAELDAMEKATDFGRLALLQKNILDVKRQAEAGKEIFAVALPVIVKADPLAAALARIAELEKKFDARFKGGVGQPAVTEQHAEVAADIAPEAAAAPGAPAPEATVKVEDAPADETEKAKKKPGFPGAAPPFGPDGKPVEEDTEKAKKVVAPPTDKVPEPAPEGDMETDDTVCAACGKPKQKGTACAACGKADAKKDDDPAVKKGAFCWAGDIAYLATQSNDA